MNYHHVIPDKLTNMIENYFNETWENVNKEIKEKFVELFNEDTKEMYLNRLLYVADNLYAEKIEEIELLILRDTDKNQWTDREKEYYLEEQLNEFFRKIFKQIKKDKEFVLLLNDLQNVEFSELMENINAKNSDSINSSELAKKILERFYNYEKNKRIEAEKKLSRKGISFEKTDQKMLNEIKKIQDDLIQQFTERSHKCSDRAAVKKYFKDKGESISKPKLEKIRRSFNRYKKVSLSKKN